MNVEKRALVLVMSLAQNDPRVRRQLTWLKVDGWTVDTIGLGPTPSDEVNTHFPVGDQRPWVKSRWGTLITYLLLNKKTMFRRLTLDRIEPEALRRIAAAEYELIVFNDFDFLPMVEDRRVFTPEALDSHLHLDIHEYRGTRRPRSLWRKLTRRFSELQRKLVGSSAFTTRSTVASRIATLYANDFGIEPPQLVRNIPPFHDLKPSVIDSHEIRMLFHGLASNQRGFDQILEAMRLLDERFHMTFMLTGNPPVVAQLRERIKEFGDRVRMVPPVPMIELPAIVNQYDLELIFYPPVHENVKFSLPNKFFEAIQGRLALVIGESPMMSELVRKYDNGIVVEGWTGADLATAISRLTVDKIAQLKANSDLAARELNSEREGEVFLSLINDARAQVG